MKFNLLDKIERVSDDCIVGVKAVSLAEEYLADHFPTFPVLPGVLMLEALTQAAGWLMHRRKQFACSMAVLKEARNVKYGNFVTPGNCLRVEVKWNDATATGAVFDALATVGPSEASGAAAATAVKARLELAYFNLADKQSGLAEIDARLRQHNRDRWALIAPAQAATTTL